MTPLTKCLGTLLNALCRETVALEIPSAFFPILSDFVDAPADVSPLDTKITPRDVYERSFALIEGSSNILTSRNATIEAIKLSLALHEASPRIQTHHQLSSRIAKPESLEDSSFVILPTAEVSSLAELEQAVPNIHKPRSSSDELFDFDHIHPSSTTGAPLAILYADPHSANFASLHRRLSTLSHDGKVRYVLRWKPGARDSPTNSRENLAGFGAALDLKRVDYLTIDDRDVASDTTAAQEIDAGADETTSTAKPSSPGGDLFDEVSGDDLVQLKPEQIEGASL